MREEGKRSSQIQKEGRKEDGSERDRKGGRERWREIVRE